jgi:P27 family predicted phage terminase small subunit
MTRGRKPKPTALKLLHGSRSDRINPLEPTPEIVIPDCPPHLDEEAKAEWGRIALELEAMGVLSRVDRAALAGYCQAWSRWVKAEDIIHKTTEVLQSKETGNFYRNPWLDVSNRALKQMHQFLVEFGMTPSSRSRVSSTNKKTSSIAKRQRA